MVILSYTELTQGGGWPIADFVESSLQLSTDLNTVVRSLPACGDRGLYGAILQGSGGVILPDQPVRVTLAGLA
ncbi:MAG TPA: hypothetical protein VK507_25240, partial [Iamia sp.]|nr:hypothetical protein [Iamia sp.]